MAKIQTAAVIALLCAALLAALTVPLSRWLSPKAPSVAKGVVADALAPCPKRPNCARGDDLPRHDMSVWAALIEQIGGTLVSQKEHYLHAQFLRCIGRINALLAMSRQTLTLAFCLFLVF